MQEDFICYLWQTQNFDKTGLATTANEPLQILSIGQQNKEAGPDFQNVRVVVNNIEWVGAVEIHVKSSDWHRHNHGINRAYESVILHVVWKNDEAILRPDGSEIPTLELCKKTDKALVEKCKDLLLNKEPIACNSQFESVSDIIKISMLDRASMQRLERKAQLVSDLHKNNSQDWEETAYQTLAQNFGFKINAEPFLRLAQNLPIKILQKHRDNLSQIEALLFGQAGFLENPTDEYSLSQKKEYDSLAAKYDLKTKQLAQHEWKFLRLRPANFPTVRLAQFAALIHRQSSLFSLFINTQSVDNLTITFKLQTSDYWQKHFQIGKNTDAKIPKMGKSSVENIAINTVVPLLVAYSQHKDQPELITQATNLLETLPAENNAITEQWAKLGMKVKTAFDSQALIELYNNFCTPKKCLTCGIGTNLLKKQ